jgi:hypothetical protein
MFSASKTIRLFLFNISVFVLVGIGLTGFDEVHWFSYFIPAFLLLAAATGFCPGLLVSRKMLGIFGIKD